MDDKCTEKDPALNRLIPVRTQVSMDWNQLRRKLFHRERFCAR
ncbi:MAG: hypothetical protein RR014_00890 [Bilophila sp.]